LHCFLIRAINTAKNAALTSSYLAIISYARFIPKRATSYLTEGGEAGTVFQPEGHSATYG